MRLQVTPIVNVSDVNSFRYATEVQAVAGDPTDFYFQLFDADRKFCDSSLGLRYMPPALSTLQVTFKNIDDAKVVQRFATQPFAQDPSIWKVSTLATDPIAGTVNVSFVLTEPDGLSTITRKVSVRAIFQSGVN